MKTLLVKLLLAILPFTFFACASKGTQAENGNNSSSVTLQEEEKEIVPIELNKRIISVDNYEYLTDSIVILQGNGGYEIEFVGFQPCKEYEGIFLTFEEQARIWIEGNTIKVERIEGIPDDFWFVSDFVLIDNAGIRKSFVVYSAYVMGIPEFND